jgi:hypothetical protein
VRGAERQECGLQSGRYEAGCRSQSDRQAGVYNGFSTGTIQHLSPCSRRHSLQLPGYYPAAHLRQAACSLAHLPVQDGHAPPLELLFGGSNHALVQQRQEPQPPDFLPSLERYLHTHTQVRHQAHCEGRQSST